MKIVIAGAGDIGFHLAKLLSFELQDITLIDTNQDVLDYAATHLDVATIRGDSASISILNEANVNRADLFMSVTTSEKNNLVSAILAKKLGAKQTIARISNPEYLQSEQRESFSALGIDHIFSPAQLASQEIERLVKRCEVTDIFNFEDGKIVVLGITIDDSSSFLGKPIREINLSLPSTDFRPIAILRGNSTIIPRGDLYLNSSDHIYFIARQEISEDLLKVLGRELKKVKNVMIIGGNQLGLATAKLLGKHYNVSLVEPDKERCKFLVEQLHDTLVIKGDPSNIEFLKEEGLGNMDAFIALTPNSEINIITSLMAEDAGVFKTIALVDNIDYTHISQNIGVDTLINKKLISANNIFRFVRKGKIEAITSLHGVNAEIIEFIVQKNNRLTKKPLKDLHFPKQALIGGVIRGEESHIPTGEFQLQVEDKVIVFALPEAISGVERMFR